MLGSGRAAIATPAALSGAAQSFSTVLGLIPDRTRSRLEPVFRRHRRNQRLGNQVGSVPEISCQDRNSAIDGTLRHLNLIMSTDFEHLSDDQLVARCLASGASDERLWSELFRRHRQLVWSVCRRYFRNREDLADMVQETFLRALRGLGGYEGGQSALFQAWIARVAGNTCKNELRRRARRLPMVQNEVTSEMAVFDSVAVANTEASKRRERLLTAMGELAATEKEILQLADLEELPYREIAAQLNISLSAVKMRVLRARAALAVVLRSVKPEAK